LAAKARDIAKSLGYTDRPASRVFEWEDNQDYLRYARQQKDTSHRWARLPTNQPPAILFWYQESPDYLVTGGLEGLLGNTLAPLGPGMRELLLDSEGRLVEFRAWPRSWATQMSPGPGPDWSPLFALAGLDLARFTPAQPSWMPEAPSDLRAAWTGAYPGAPEDPLRVEAAAYQGRTVFFKVIGPWSRTAQPPAALAALPFLLFFFVILPAGASLLAWRNARLGRGDRRGAFRVALFGLLSALVAALLRSTHVPALLETAVLFRAWTDSLMFPASLWVLYMALEPYVRRRSPETLISWNRLLSGRLRDPLLGGDLLVGVVVGIVSCLLLALGTLAAPFAEPLGPRVLNPQLTIGAGASFADWVKLLGSAVGGGLSQTFVLFLLWVLLKRRWLAVLLFVTMQFLVSGSGALFPVRDVLLVLVYGLWGYTVMRFGVVTAVTFVFTWIVLAHFPLTADLSAWYATSALLTMASVLALAIYGFRTTLAGRPLWRDQLQQA
jgi:hypothetical protein